MASCRARKWPPASHWVHGWSDVCRDSHTHTCVPNGTEVQQCVTREGPLVRFSPSSSNMCSWPLCITGTLLVLVKQREGRFLQLLTLPQPFWGLRCSQTSWSQTLTGTDSPAIQRLASLTSPYIGLSGQSHFFACFLAILISWASYCQISLSSGCCS